MGESVRVIAYLSKRAQHGFVVPRGDVYRLEQIPKNAGDILVMTIDPKTRLPDPKTKRYVSRQQLATIGVLE